MNLFEEKISSFFKIYMFATIIVCFTTVAGSFSTDYVLNLIIAVLLAVAAIPVYFLGKKHYSIRILNPIMNAVAIGLAIASVFIYKSITLQLKDILIPLVILILLFIVNNTIDKPDGVTKKQIIINIIIGAAVFAFCLISREKKIVLNGLGLFLSIYYIFAFVSLIFLNKTGRLWYALSIMFFSTFAIVLIIALMIISESADGLEILGDIGEIGTNQKKKRG